MQKKISFLTGTRADFGKIYPIILMLSKKKVNVELVVTGMHLLKVYGFTINEIYKKLNNVKIIPLYNQDGNFNSRMELILSNTINQLSFYLNESKPDLFVVHGDRPETLAGSISASFNNILVGHIEGGEVSGTIDESIRHAVSKLAHIHFVSNKESEKRLIQMGEDKKCIFKVGSGEVDIIKKYLPKITKVKKYYNIYFKEYAILIFHPVTTEYKNIKNQVREVLKAVKLSDQNYVIINSNNDLGSTIIRDELKSLESENKFLYFPSIRFEFFLTLLKGAKFILGNSSSGVREAPVFGTPTINVGTRQNNRSKNSSIINVSTKSSSIIDAIKKIKARNKPTRSFGDGNTAEKFFKIINSDNVWKISRQKKFNDII